MLSLVIILLIGYFASYLLKQYIILKNPATGHFINVPYHGKNIRLHYIDSLSSVGLSSDINKELDPQQAINQRPTLVLIHGATGNLQDFTASIYDSLITHYRVIAFDRPGLGYSQRPKHGPSQHWCDPGEQMELLHSAIVTLGIKKPFILGHSLAGPIMLDYMLNYPEELSGSIMLSPVSHPWPNGVTWYNYIDMFPVLKHISAYTWLPIMGYLNVNSGLNKLFAPEKAPEKYRQKTALDLFFQPKMMLDNFRDQRLLCEYVAIAGRQYRQISTPVQIISMQKDDIVTTWLHSEKLSYELQNGQWFNIPGAGHSPHHSHPQVVVDTIKNFINQQQNKSKKSRL